MQINEQTHTELEDARNAERTILADVISNTGDKELLRLIVASIFPDVILSCFRNELLAHLTSHGRHVGIERLDHEIRVFATEQRAVNRLTSSLHNTVLARLEESKEKTRRNSIAYSNPSWQSVFWPNPINKDTPRSQYDMDNFPFFDTPKIVSKTTPIATAGSCFVYHITRLLKERNYRFVQTEPNTLASADWGVLYNSPSFRQIVEKAFGLCKLPRLLVRIKKENRSIYVDPFREAKEFASIEEYESDYDNHVRASKEAFLKCRVLWITLSINEIWQLRSDHSVLTRSLWSISPSLIESRVLTVDDNVTELETMLRILRRYNPGIKLILSVCPVPIHATFRGHEHHVISANCHSKSVLRVATEEFCRRNKGVHYFPAYETVHHCIRDAWEQDMRHVHRKSYDRVMDLFEKMFLDTQAQQNTE